MLGCRTQCRLILFLLLAANPAWSQGTRRAPIKPPELPKFNISGTLDRLDGNRIVLTTEAGYTWLLQPMRDLQVELTGKAKPAFLAPGQFIAFLAKLDKRRSVTLEKVVRLTIFTPDKHRQPGIMPDLGFGELEQKTLGANPSDSEKPATANKQPGGKPGAAAGSGPAANSVHAQGSAPNVIPANIESFVIHGMITSVKNGKLLVQVPDNPFVKPSLQIEVAEDADIDVELKGLPVLTLVRPGDHIQARGDQVGEGLGFTNHLSFRLAQALGTPPPPKKPPPKAKQPSGTNSAQTGDKPSE